MGTLLHSINNMSTVYHECKKCGHEIEMDYDLGEHFAECSDGEPCPECGEPINLDYNDLEEQAMNNMINRADMMRDD